MSGIDAARGFLYQGFASILETLSDQNNWDKIFFEPSKNVDFQIAQDKVDIALKYQNKLVKCIQVKSSINTFTKDMIQNWLNELKNDISSPKYELFLIGSCNTSANQFMKSIHKYYSGINDTEVESLLKEFNLESFKNSTIEFCILPFNYLKPIVNASMHKYLSQNDQIMTYEQIDFITSGIVTDQMMASINGKEINRSEFENWLNDKISLLVDKYNSQRISIGIFSFAYESQKIESQTQACLSLVDMFNERTIKHEYDWNQHILKKVESFLQENTDSSQTYQLFLEAHLSIGFIAGRVLRSKFGINIFPVQKTATNDGTVLWDVKQPTNKKYPDWEISHETLAKNCSESALILNVRFDIHNNVIDYIKNNNLTIGHVINCTPSENAFTNYSIQDGTHASLLANSIGNELIQRDIEERRSILHIFAAAPIAFMFFLGQNSFGFGKCILYEYDFEQHGSCTYSQSIKFID